jgi:NADPH:quinone reductase
MKAVRFHQTGGPEVLVYEDVPDATTPDGEVLIRVEAVGLNFADVMRRRGDNYPEASPPPFTLGVEVAGTVAAVGEGVTWLNIGHPVAGRHQHR